MKTIFKPQIVYSILAVIITSSARAGTTPSEFVAARAQKVLTALKSQPFRLSSNDTKEISCSASKTPWLEALYANGVVDSSWATEMLADKRIFAEVLKSQLGDQAVNYYPKTLGLREFLVKRSLLKANGDIAADGDQIEQALHDEFPSGFVVRPAVGVAPLETGKGLFTTPDAFIIELLKPTTVLYSANQLKEPIQSHFLGAVASGEAVVLQESVLEVADLHKKLQHKVLSEVRIHTFENHVIENALPERWVQTETLSVGGEHAAEAYVEKFLQGLPIGLLNRQAWGVDVAVFDNGDFRITDVVTNRGKHLSWSSYLDQPKVIEAYTKHFEANAGVHFAGFSGMLLRNGWANYFAYWAKRIEMAKPGWSKVLAYLPPL